MSCTWTTSREYSDFINVIARGDMGVLSTLYQPTKKGTVLVGEAIYINMEDPANHTVTSPSCTAFLAGQNCNDQVALNKALLVDKQCIDDCAILAVDKAEKGKAIVIAMLNTLIPLIYADAIANGTEIKSDATPTAAQLQAAFMQAMLAIKANGGYPGCIVLDLTTAASTLAGFGALYQPAPMVEIDFSYGPGTPLGNILGWPVFVTPTNLADAAATPVQVDGLVIAKMGYAYAYQGENFGISIEEERHDATNNVIGSLCAGYGFTNAALVYYISRED